MIYAKDLSHLAGTVARLLKPSSRTRARGHQENWPKAAAAHKAEQYAHGWHATAIFIRR